MTSINLFNQIFICEKSLKCESLEIADQIFPKFLLAIQIINLLETSLSVQVVCLFREFHFKISQTRIWTKIASEKLTNSFLSRAQQDQQGIPKCKLLLFDFFGLLIHHSDLYSSFSRVKYREASNYS